MTEFYRKATEGERTIEVPSFSDPSKTYSVDLEIASCDCPRYEHRGNCVKHVVLAEALLKSRSRKYRFEREVSERVVTELCRRIFEAKRTTASEAHTLYCEVVGSKYSTARMRTAALRRSRRAIAVEAGRVVA